MTLPELPKAERIEAAQFCDDAYWFSAEQMREYGQLVRQQVLKEAAELADEVGGRDRDCHAYDAAAAIWALKTGETK